jgi:hypothetical protein
MLIVLFVLLFYIVHCCIDIADRSLSSLYFNKIILSYECMKVIYSPFAIQSNSVFKENNLMSQRIITSCLLAFAEFQRVSELL